MSAHVNERPAQSIVVVVVASLHRLFCSKPAYIRFNLRCCLYTVTRRWRREWYAVPNIGWANAIHDTHPPNDWWFHPVKFSCSHPPLLECVSNEMLTQREKYSGRHRFMLNSCDNSVEGGGNIYSRTYQHFCCFAGESKPWQIARHDFLKFHHEIMWVDRMKCDHTRSTDSISLNLSELVSIHSSGEATAPFMWRVASMLLMMAGKRVLAIE